MQLHKSNLGLYMNFEIKKTVIESSFCCSEKLAQEETKNYIKSLMMQ